MQMIDLFLKTGSLDRLYCLKHRAKKKAFNKRFYSSRNLIPKIREILIPACNFTSLPKNYCHSILHVRVVKQDVYLRSVLKECQTQILSK